MSKTFTNKTSYSLLKSNPKLTSNIKLVVDSIGSIFIESIDGSPELSRNKYKRVKLDTENNWSSAIYDFFNSGTIPESILYSIKDNEDFYSVKKDYSKQYYTNYQQGATPKISKLYDEQISYFAPIWLEPNDIPEHFAIFKIKEPVSVSTKDETVPYSEVIEKQIYNTNYFSGATDSDYFYKTILSKAKLHKVFDMGPDSTLGTYLRNHINDPNMPESSLTIDWDINKQSTVNGISLRNSGFTKESFNLFSEAFPVDRTITEFDNLITNQFQLNGVIHPNIINLEFLFDDESNEEFEVSRYFGVYFNRNEFTKFKLDSKAFYDKKYENLPQNKDIKSINTVDVLSDNNIPLENVDGVKLFVDFEGDYEILSTDVKGSDTLPYIYSTDGNFFDINNNVDWGNNEVVLKDTLVNSNEFKGFTKDSLGIIPSTKTNKDGRSYFEFKIEGQVNSFELRIRNVFSEDVDFNLNQVFIGDDSLEAGTHISNKFSLSGNPEDVANALVSVINTYAESDEDFNVYAITKFDKVIIFTRGTNEYWNNYQFLLYSEDYNFENNIYVPYNEFEDIITFNNNRVLNGKSRFVDYDTTLSGATFMYEDADYKILQSTFIGGNNESEFKIRIPIEYKEYFSKELYLKSKTWYSPIVSICAYLDEPVYQNGRIVNFSNFDSYMTINSKDDIYISKGAFSELYDIETNRIGLMSMYPTKQFDVDQFRSEYGKDGDGFIELLKDNYLSKEITPVDEIKNSITSFKESGFKRLGGSLNESTGEISKIINEYDRLLENQLPELAIKGRIIPFINKWVYDDDGSDVRENNYRLTSNSAFSYNNFSPSSINRIPDFRFFTHEWYYLQKYPLYLTTAEEKINTFSYFEEYLDKNDLKDIIVDNFTNYFTQTSVDGVSFPMRTKYTTVSGGNNEAYSETFFRGAKLKFKRRTENDTSLNFNIDLIGTFPSNEFNDYKFSTVLTNNTTSPLEYTIIENKKFKNITMYIEANLDDYYLNQGPLPESELFLDRSSLYILEDKFDTSGVYADVSLSGAISPFKGMDTNPVDNFTLKNGIYKIFGNSNSVTESIPNFEKQIIPNNSGAYNDVNILVNGGVLTISGILSVSKNTITASIFYFETSYGTKIPITTGYDNRLPVPSVCLKVIPTYLKGGYNAYKGILEDLSFASIFDKVNSGSPDIKYVTIDEDGNEDSNTFVLEFDNYVTNTKADYIKVEPIIFNGIKNSNYKPIGAKTVGMENTYISTMYRFNGNYNPKVENVMLFKEDFGNKFNSEIRDSMKFTNSQFFSAYPNFALYKQLYYNKINEQNPLDILDLNKGSALLPEFWEIGEISLDKRDDHHRDYLIIR